MEPQSQPSEEQRFVELIWRPLNGQRLDQQKSTWGNTTNQQLSSLPLESPVPTTQTKTQKESFLSRKQNAPIQISSISAQVSADPLTVIDTTTDISVEEPMIFTTVKAKASKLLLYEKLRGFFKPLRLWIWTVVLLVVMLPLLGKLIIAHSIFPAPLKSLHQELTVIIPPSLDKLDKDISQAVRTAHQSARDYAQLELDEWQGELEPRIDGFLDWYFDYFTQKRLEISAPAIWLSSATIHLINSHRTAPEEAVNSKLTQEFQKEFTKRVLVPQTAQLRFEVITTEAAALFVTELSEKTASIRSRYRIPQGQWNRYLETIATTVNDTEGHLSNLSLKTLVGGGGYLAAKPLLVPTLAKVGSKVSVKFTSSAAAKVAAKTGGSVASELGTTLVDPVVGVSIILWDLWDYQHTVAVDRPLLRSNISSYIKSMEKSLLDNPETGIMAAINQLEQNIFRGLEKR